MAKKEKVVDATKMTDEELAKTHETLRKQLREKFGKWIEVYNEEATPEDVQKCKDEFDEEIKKFRDKTFVLAKDHAAEFAQIARDWNAKFNHWENGAWKGVITLDRVLGELIDKYTKDETLPFTVDFQTLIFMFQSMSTPKGYGLDGARYIAELEHYDETTGEIAKDDNYVTYSHLLQNINDNIREVMNIDKKHKLMRERINIAIAGIKFDWKISEIEEFIELHDAWLGENVPSDEELKRM